MRVLLIVNAHARFGKQPLDPALQVFAEAGIDVVKDEVPHARQASGIIDAHAGEVDAIVLAGGDGTLHDAAEALLEAGRPIGILPLGTANDLARAVDLPLDLRQAAEVIAAGNRRLIDLGEVNGKLFFNVAHMGLGAALADSLSFKMKQRFGPLAYTVAAAKSLIGLRSFRAEVIANGERLVMRTFGITVGNGRFFGGTGIVAEDAEIDDGLLHLFALQTRSPFRLAAILPSVRSGRQGQSKWVKALSAPEIEIRTVRSLKIRADGKLTAETPAMFRVRRGALTLFAPPKVIEAGAQ